MRTLIIVSTILACLIILASCGDKQGKQAVFTGRVTAADTSVYLADVKVFEISHNKNSTTTDSLGYFRINDISFEEHNIYFEKDGFEPLTYNFEYNGQLERPIITRLIVLHKPGEDIIDSTKVEVPDNDTL